jgi:hypothetical protein
MNGSEHLSKPNVLPSNLRLGRRRNTIAQANTLRRFHDSNHSPATIMWPFLLQ